VSYREWKGCKGHFHKEWRNEAGFLHRKFAPAYIIYYPDSSIEWEIFFFNGRRHREDGPALVGYLQDGSIEHEAFYLDGIIIGYAEQGLWAFWDRLTEEQRQAPSLLKYLARYL
jgi:hypothetical protein